MELEEKDLENVLGGAPKEVVNTLKENDELDENNLLNVKAGISNRDLSDDLALQQESLYRREMIEKLKEEKRRLLEEHKMGK